MHHKMHNRMIATSVVWDYLVQPVPIEYKRSMTGATKHLLCHQIMKKDTGNQFHIFLAHEAQSKTTMLCFLRLLEERMNTGEAEEPLITWEHWNWSSFWLAPYPLLLLPMTSLWMVIKHEKNTFMEPGGFPQLREHIMPSENTGKQSFTANF